MSCPDITRLKLDQDDWEAIEDIKRRQKAGNMLEVFMPVGVLATIFLGNNGTKATFNVSGFDFLEFTKAMTKVDVIVREVIINHATRQALTPGKSTEQRQFWTAIANGCRL